MGLSFFCITQQGEGHIQRNQPCQDSSVGRLIQMEKAGCQAVVCAIADGVGGCTFSHFGAQAAVNAVLNYLEEKLSMEETVEDTRILSFLRESFSYAVSQVEKTADERQLPFAQMDSTLTCSIYMADGSLWYGHVGDDGLVALYTDGTYEKITRRDKGEAENEVYPLRDRSMWSFGKAPKPVASAVLLTDGVLDMAVSSRTFGEDVYFPFLGMALANPMSSPEETEKYRQRMDDYLHSPGFRSQVSDDITFTAFQNSDLVADLPEIIFDAAAWKEKHKKIAEEKAQKIAQKAKEYFGHMIQQPLKQEDKPKQPSQTVDEKWNQVLQDGKRFLQSTGDALQSSMSAIVNGLADAASIIMDGTQVEEKTGTVESESKADSVSEQNQEDVCKEQPVTPEETEQQTEHITENKAVQEPASQEMTEVEGEADKSQKQL